MEIGIDPSSLRAEEVLGLTAGSRAELSGLQNGDKIIKSSRFGEALSRFKMKFRYVIERDGQEIKGEYWPRSFDRVSSLQLQE